MTYLSMATENCLKNAENWFLNLFSNNPCWFGFRRCFTNKYKVFRFSLFPYSFKIIALLAFNSLLLQVKTCSLPTLPRYRELASKLGPVHAKLANKSSIAKKHPVYWCNESQVIMDCCILADLAICFSSSPHAFCFYSTLKM